MKNGLEIDERDNKIYYLNDLIHNEDGPAIINTHGTKCWCQHGKLHRIDGPAVEHSNGRKAWYYQNKYIDCQNQQEFERLIKLLAFI